MFEDKFCELKDRDYSVEVVDRSLNNWLEFRAKIISIIFIAFTYTYFIYTRDTQDTIVSGILLGKLIELQWNLVGLLHASSHVNFHIRSYKKCLNIENIPQEAEQHLDIPKTKNGDQWISQGQIQFNDYSVRYRPDTQIVLNKVSVNIEPKQKIGIVGRTGAGKSTLCLALCRIIEKLEGSIQIDGVDISTVGLADLRDRITIIPQDPVLFTGTLRFNLDPLNKHQDNKLIDIIERAGLKSLLDRDGNGLDFKISYKGDNLSAGEKALVCICRAALRKSKVVLLDEATASIDVETEEAIQKLIMTEFEDSTMLTVAHRLNTIINSDKIMLMRDGKVAEFESPEVLKNDTKSEFYELLSEFNN